MWKKKEREMVKYPAKHGKTWALVQGNMAKCFLLIPMQRLKQ